MTMRDVVIEDKEAIRKFVNPDVFYESGRDAKVILDSDGNPVFYALFTDIKRLDVLFVSGNHLTTAKAMKKLADYVDSDIKKDVVTESEAKPLIRFMNKIGFNARPQTFVRNK